MAMGSGIDVDKLPLAVVGERIVGHAMAVDQHQSRIDREAAQGHSVGAARHRAAERLRQGA